MPTEGWHADPHGRHELRYHNGTVWTEHVSNHGATSSDPLRDVVAARRTPFPTWAKFLTGAVVLLVIIAAASGGGDKKSPGAAHAITSNTPAAGTEGSKTVAAAAATPIPAASPSTTDTSPPPKRVTGLAANVGPDTPSMDRRTRSFMNTLQVCRAEASLVVIEASRASAQDNVISFTSDVTSARDTCDGARSTLATSDTKHFDDQAADAFYAADRFKSGLNALLAYIDDPRPSKIIEARNKLSEARAAATDALHKINVRRHVYGLKAYQP